MNISNWFTFFRLLYEFLPSTPSRFFPDLPLIFGRTIYHCAYFPHSLARVQAAWVALMNIAQATIIGTHDITAFYSRSLTRFIRTAQITAMIATHFDALFALSRGYSLVPRRHFAWYQRYWAVASAQPSLHTASRACYQWSFRRILIRADSRLDVYRRNLALLYALASFHSSLFLQQTTGANVRFLQSWYYFWWLIDISRTQPGRYRVDAAVTATHLLFDFSLTLHWCQSFFITVAAIALQYFCHFIAE